MGKNFKTIDEAVIRFAGDSGDGMQLTGGRFTETTAIVGNDLSTLPDFPAEIRAPAGSLAGVSAFQLKFSSKDIHTPGDKPDVLVAMNPAALKVHQKDYPIFTDLPHEMLKILFCNLQQILQCLINNIYARLWRDKSNKYLPTK